MDKQPTKFDWIAWYTSIPGIPADWPAPKVRPAPVIELHAAKAWSPSAAATTTGGRPDRAAA